MLTSCYFSFINTLSCYIITCRIILVFTKILLVVSYGCWKIINCCG
nr:MAG TPA: hypothetical protein [Caudoviricetes sp.]